MFCLETTFPRVGSRGAHLRLVEPLPRAVVALHSLVLLHPVVTPILGVAARYYSKETPRLERNTYGVD